jgi:hypothetical protein
MGIRFTCPVCEKRIHVKSFLAGKRGICPKCGGKVQIPTQSTAGRHAVASVASGGVVASAGSGHSQQSDAEAGPPVPPGGYATVSPVYPQASASPALASGPAPVTPAAVSDASIPTAVPGAPSAAVSSGPNSSNPVSNNPAPTGIAQARPAHLATAAPVAPAQVARPAADPLAEAPQAKWYVRPPSGGQFGPAAADCMRRWVDEGRVSADSLVWREGWSDWKKSSDVFPEIGAIPSAPAAPMPPADGGLAVATGFPATAPTATARPLRRKKKSNAMAIGMLVTLSIVAVGLLVGLMIVLNNS